QMELIFDALGKFYVSKLNYRTYLKLLSVYIGVLELITDDKFKYETLTTVFKKVANETETDLTYVSTRYYAQNQIFLGVSSKVLIAEVKGLLGEGTTLQSNE